MEKGYRIVQCPGSTVQRCGRKLRLSGITEKDYNQRKNIRCPKCDLEFQTTIHAPEKEIEEQVPPHDPLRERVEEKDPFGILDQLNRIFGRNK